MPDEAFEEVVFKGTIALEAFPLDEFVNRLHNKVRACIGSENNSDAVQKHIDRAPHYFSEGSDGDSLYLDGFLAYYLLYGLLLSAASDRIASVDSNLDSDNLKRFGNSKLRYLKPLINPMSFCLGEHVNTQLRSQGKCDLNEIYQIEGFKNFVLDQITADEFIARGNDLFSIVWLLLADYFQNREFAFRISPAPGPEFDNKASQKIMIRWSYNLPATEDKGNLAEMDKIATFCGKVDTISICPPNATTGLQRSSPVTTEIKSFYIKVIKTPNDVSHTKDLKDSLEPLADNQEVMNEWKSYCDALTSSWEIQVRHYWNAELFRLQDGKSREVKFWIATASNNQWNMYLWDSYLPILGNKYDKRSKSTPACRISAGVLITPCDGKPWLVEDVPFADQILTQASPNSSVTAIGYIINRPMQTKLIRFNGESLSFPSSWVFHSPTGLRVVNREAAQRLNLFQIGQLNVRHIVFHPQEDEHDAVHTKGIEQTKENALDRVCILKFPGYEQALHTYGYLLETNVPGHTLKQTTYMLRKVPDSRILGILSHWIETRPMLKRFGSQCINEQLNWELFGQYKSPDDRSPKLKRSASFGDHPKIEQVRSRPTRVAIECIARGFSLTAHHPSRLLAGYELSTLILADCYLLIQDKVQIWNAYDFQDRSFHWTRELKQQILFGDGSVQIDLRTISGNGAIHLSPDPDAQAMLVRDQLHLFLAHAQNLKTLHTTQHASEDTWKVLSTYNVTLDQSLWPADTEQTKLVEPIDEGTFEDGYIVSSANLRSCALCLPLVEQFRDQINQKFSQKLELFYKTISQFRDGLESFKVLSSCAPLVHFVSAAWLDPKNEFCVGFQPNLDIDVTLPTLFQQMNIAFGVKYENFTGYLFGYDLVKRGYMGERTLAKGTAQTSSAADRVRFKISQAYASIFKLAVPGLLDEKLQPALVIKNFLKATEETIDNLMQLTSYQVAVLYNDMHQYIQQMMHYHIDNKERKQILRDEKPIIDRDIPESLVDNLPSKLKAFFKEKHAPASVCRYPGRTQKNSGSFADQRMKAAFGGSALFKGTGEAFDKLCSKILDKLPGIGKLKGLSSICMTSVSLVSASVSLWGLVENWDSVSDAGKATVIIEAIGMVTDASGKAIDAFKSFASKPALTAAGQINTKALDESRLSKTRGSNKRLSNVAQEILGGEKFRTAIGGGICGEEVPMEGGANETWGQDVSNDAEDILPEYKDAAKKSNIPGNILQIFNVVLGVGLLLAILFSLADDWNSMSDTGKILGVLSAIVQGLTVLLDIVEFAAETGVIAIIGTMSEVLPIFGTVLTVTGIVLMITQVFVNPFITRQPPTSSIQDLINNVGHALIKSFDPLPKTQLEYSISSTSVNANSVTTLMTEGLNNTKREATLSHTSVNLYSGDDDVRLFQNDADFVQLVLDDDSNQNSSGYTYATPQEVTAGQLPVPDKLGNNSNYYQDNLQKASLPKHDSTAITSLLLKSGEKLNSVLTAVVNKKGYDKEKSTSWIEVIQTKLKVKCRYQFKVMRV
ncbi:uncharacterized protein N7479_002799 [Penicillium vulpinum]|uniref:Uncharacterized protein n=1 Tax=Penicillium vulpinum TaxID=29845 RepID=A0A1V6RTM6_9EURO|nr:uncharacterized protein N7479_002799 [Penicillium vulpinum]KAJ5972881.1 hypothetical protein N7479_002799 [Penicillium vulpinum]OQE04763.1 hypothetical protein PENVUL_c030G08923 [Penicillium vulpinum]